MSIKNLFHKLSYLQYPLMAVGIFYIAKSNYWLIVLKRMEIPYGYYNNALLFFGIAISISTLQDTGKTQNDFSKKVWEDPKKGKIALLLIFLLASLLISGGFIGLYVEASSGLKELSLGLIVLGIGMINLLKSASEMFENHRKDNIISPPSPEITISEPDTPL